MSRPHIKLQKKRSTKEQIIHEIHSLLHGTGARPYPLTITETAKVLRVSRDTVYRYVKKMNGNQGFSRPKTDWFCQNPQRMQSSGSSTRFIQLLETH